MMRLSVMQPRNELFVQRCTRKPVKGSKLQYSQLS